MSQFIQNTENSMHDLILNAAEVTNMLPHLQTDDFQDFLRWFDKLRMIDARATWIYLLELQPQNPMIRQHVEHIYHKRL